MLAPAMLSYALTYTDHKRLTVWHDHRVVKRETVERTSPDGTYCKYQDGRVLFTLKVMQPGDAACPLVLAHNVGKLQSDDGEQQIAQYSDDGENVDIVMATIPSKPYTFSSGTLIQSAQVNSDFDTLYSTLNAQLDSTNFSLARGLGANYIQSGCSGCTGVFNPGAYTVTAGTAASVPVTVLGATSQSADLVDICSTSCGAAKYVWVDGGGILHTNQTISGNATTATTLQTPRALNGTNFDGSAAITVPTNVTADNATNADVPMLFANTGGNSQASGSANMVYHPSTAKVTFSGNANFLGILQVGSTIGGGIGAGEGSFATNGSSGRVTLGGSTENGKLDYGVGAAHGFTLTCAGGSCSTNLSIGTGTSQGSSNGSTVSYHPPVYAPGGSAIASTVHGVVGSQVVTITPACSNLANCGITGAGITFSGAAAFASISAYGCTASANNTGYIWTWNNTSGGGTNLGLVNYTGGTIANNTTITVSWQCFGT